MTKNKNKHALRDYFIYTDNPKAIKEKWFNKRLRRLGRLDGSSIEELQDMSRYNKVVPKISVVVKELSVEQDNSQNVPKNVH